MHNLKEDMQYYIDFSTVSSWELSVKISTNFGNQSTSMYKYVFCCF